MSSASSSELKKFKTVENIVNWTGVALGVASAIYIYLTYSSFWLAFFVFICVAKFFGGELPHVIYHKKRLRRILYYLTFPLFATVILYFTYQWWGKMWLSVLLGLVIGFILNVLISGLFNIKEIYTEDQQKLRAESNYEAEISLDKNPDAVAMKERFTDDEWREIKALPPFMLGLVAMTSVTKQNKVNQAVIKKYIDILYDPEKIANPLLRMMLIDNRLEMNAKFGEMNPLMILSQMDKLMNTDAFAAITAGAKPESMVIVENTLNPEEYRGFVRALLEFTLKLASATGKQNPQQLQIIFQFFANFAGSKQDLLAMMDGVDLK